LQKGERLVNYELRQYSFGQTIGKGFNLYFDNFIPVVLVSLVCQIPMVLFLYFTGFMKLVEYETFSSGYYSYFFFLIIWMIIAQSFLSAFTIHLVAKKFLENTPTGRENNFTSIFPLFLPVLGVTFVVGIAMVFGFFTCIVPGILIWLGFSIATEVLVIERRTVGESMNRSWNLTKGRKGTVFLISFVAGLIVFGITQGVMLLVRFSPLDVSTVTCIEYGVGAITNPIYACIMIVLYFNLRIEKEGFNIEHLAQQFTLADTPADLVLDSVVEPKAEI
jgi:hypothetical protein